MTGWLMRRCRPGGFAWLTLHELRVAILLRERKLAIRILGWLVLLGYLAGGVAIALALRETRFEIAPIALTIVLAVSLLVFSFMTTQALLASQRTLYEAGDLDLLLTAPLDPRTVIAAKLAGIAGGVATSFAFLILPLTLPFIVLGHPELIGIPALLVALALLAACLGLGLTLAVARIGGPRAARTLGQILAALFGGALFLASQLFRDGSDSTRSGMGPMFEKLVGSGVGSAGPLALPGRAAFGDPPAIALLLGGAVIVLALTAFAMQTLFLSSYRAGGMKLSRTRKARGGIARRFRRSLFAAILAKEWRLLARDPALAFQIVLRLIYLAPLFLVALHHNDGIPLAPTLAMCSVVVAGQLVGSLAWLAVAAEDSPDLIAVAPVAKEELDQAKLFAAMLMAAPLAVLLPIGIALQTLAGALVTLGMTAVGGGLVGHLVVTYAEPARRSKFQRRNQGSLLLGLFEFLITLALGLVTGVIVYFIQRLL